MLRGKERGAIPLKTLYLFIIFLSLYLVKDFFLCVSRNPDWGSKNSQLTLLQTFSEIWVRQYGLVVWI